MTPTPPTDPAGHAASNRTGRPAGLYRSPWELLNERINLLAQAVPPDGHILEIGPLSAISSFLLAGFVVPEGRVVSTYTDPMAAATARKLLTATAPNQVQAVEVDHHEQGAPEHAPDDGYAAVVVWGAWQQLPDAWVKQTAEDGRLLVSMYVAPLMDATALCCLTCTRDGGLGLRLLPGEPSPYDLLASEPLRPYIDGVTQAPAGGVSLVSGPWLRPGRQPDARATVNGQQASMLLDRLHDGRRRLQSWLWWDTPGGLCLLGERRDDLRVWLLVAAPGSLTTACFENLPGWFGCADADGVALVHTTSGTGVTAGAHEPATAALAGLVASWRAAGRPGWVDLCPCLRNLPGGWRLEVSFPETSQPVDQQPAIGDTTDLSAAKGWAA